MNTETQEIIRVEEITSIMMNAGEVLTKNQNLSEKAVSKAKFLLDTIEGEGMSDVIDQEVNDWMVKAKQADTMLKQRRSPITQMANQIVKAFTALEAPFDSTKKDSFFSNFQIHRNAWAKSKADLQREEEKKILRNQNIAKEKIELKASIEQMVRDAYLTKLYTFKKFGQDTFNKMTLETVEEIKKAIADLKIVYPRDKFNELAINVTSIYLDPAKLAGLIFDTRSGLYDELAANFRENMEALKVNLLDQVPSKVNELKEIAKAGADARKKLEQDALERQQKEDQRLKEEAAEAKKQSEQNISLNKQMDNASTLFDTAAQLAEVKESNTGKTRSGYKINVLNTAGWGAIFMFYFEKEGMTLTVDDMGKKTMNQMKAFCEKYAHKEGEKIQSSHLSYEEDLKAVVTKEK